MSQTGSAPNQSSDAEGPTPAEKLVAADALCRSGKLEEGHAALSDLIAQHPVTGEAVTAARALWQYGWPEEAVQALPKIIAAAFSLPGSTDGGGVMSMAIATLGHLGSDDEILARLRGPNLLMSAGLIRVDASPLWLSICRQLVDSLGKRSAWTALLTAAGDAKVEMALRIKAAALLIRAQGQSHLLSILSDKDLPVELKVGALSVLPTVLPGSEAITTLKSIMLDPSYAPEVRRAAGRALGSYLGDDVAAIVTDKKRSMPERLRAIQLLSEMWQIRQLQAISMDHKLDLKLRLDACHRLVTELHVRDAAVWMVAEVVSKRTPPELRDAYEQFLREHDLWEDVVVDLALVSQYRERRAR